MKLNQLSIKWKLFFYIALFAFVMVAVLWFFQILFLDSFYQHIKTGQIKSTAETLVENIENEDLQDLVDRLSQSDDTCILILDENGAPLYSADILFDCMIHRTHEESLLQWQAQAIENGGTYLETFSRERFQNKNFDRNGFKGRVPPPESQAVISLVCVKHVVLENGQSRTAFLNSSISPVSSTVETLRIQLVYITVILIILAFALALYISRQIARPVIMINNSAKRLSKGDYDVQFEGKGYREIVQLSETLNTAAYELSRVENLRRELIANVSHDLRTPLTMIVGFAEVIRDLPGENTPENAQIIIDEADRLNRLVTDLLDLSRLQAGAENLNLTDYNLTNSVRDTITRFSKHLEKEGGSISFDAKQDVYVNADELHISQVIYNLIANAATHSAKGTPVIVKQAVENGRVKIQITDRGPGIPKDQLPYIWERYYKVDKTHMRAQVGSGLGLSIVRGTLEMHNAEYGVESAEGAGSTFWFSLPIVKIICD